MVSHITTLKYSVDILYGLYTFKIYEINLIVEVCIIWSTHFPTHSFHIHMYKHLPWEVCPRSHQMKHSVVNDTQFTSPPIFPSSGRMFASPWEISVYEQLKVTPKSKLTCPEISIYTRLAPASHFLNSRVLINSRWSEFCDGSELRSFDSHSQIVAAIKYEHIERRTQFDFHEWSAIQFVLILRELNTRPPPAQPD